MLLTWQEPVASQRGSWRCGGLGNVLGAHRVKEMGDAVSWGKSRQMFQLNRVHLGPVYCSAVRVVLLLFPVVPLEIQFAWQLIPG